MGGIWHKLELISLPVKIIEKLCQYIEEEFYTSKKKKRGPLEALVTYFYAKKINLEME